MPNTNVPISWYFVRFYYSCVTLITCNIVVYFFFHFTITMLAEDVHHAEKFQDYIGPKTKNIVSKVIIQKTVLVQTLRVKLYCWINDYTVVKLISYFFYSYIKSVLSCSKFFFSKAPKLCSKWSSLP